MPETPMGGDPILNIVGEKVALGPLRKDLLPVYQRWINDLESARNLGGHRPFTFEEEEDWYARATKSDAMVPFTVYERETLTPVGTAFLGDVDQRNRKAEFGIFIGPRDARDKGYGTETTRLVLDYAFNAVGLHNVMLRVFEFNRAGIRVYEKAGFREIGRRRQSCFMGGGWWDDIYMDCLSTEFERLVTPGKGAAFRATLSPSGDVDIRLAG